MSNDHLTECLGCKMTLALPPAAFVAIVEAMREAGYTDEMLASMERLPLVCGECVGDIDCVMFPPPGESLELDGLDLKDLEWNRETRH